MRTVDNNIGGSFRITSYDVYHKLPFSRFQINPKGEYEYSVYKVQYEFKVWVFSIWLTILKYKIDYNTPPPLSIIGIEKEKIASKIRQLIYKKF